MGSQGRFIGSVGGWADFAVRSSVVPDLERISRSVKILVTITTPSFFASSIVRGAGRWDNISKLEASQPATPYSTASAYFSTGSISGLYVLIPLIARGRIESSWYFVEIERRSIQCWSEGSPRFKQRLGNLLMANLPRPAVCTLTRGGKNLPEHGIRPTLGQAREWPPHLSLRLPFHQRARV